MKKGKGRNNGLLPNSLRIISSCLKTVSTNAGNVASSVRSAGASVAASISASEDLKDQVTWAGFDKLELNASVIKHVLLLGYQNGFQVFDVEDASNFSELVSKRDAPVSFLQMQPLPAMSDGQEGFRKSHPLLLVVAGDDAINIASNQSCPHSGVVARDGKINPQTSKCISPTTVRFYSLTSHNYVHVLRFRSPVCMVRCSSRIIAVGLATQIYCFDGLTLEKKFSVLTFPVPQLAGQGSVGVNVGYGPMAVGPRWLAYASNNPLMSTTGRLSPQSLTPSPAVSPSTSPGASNVVARYAVESSKHLAAGLMNLGDMGYKTLSKYCQELLPDGSSSPVSPNSIWKVGRLAGSDAENAGMVVVKDFVSRAVISQFKAHTSPISALCFDPSGTLLVTASVYGNNINIFRIMPPQTQSGSSGQEYDWRSSHVHLYKLHRGITSAIIQDICFNRCSEWIAIISSKGTCHIFVLSPFGGNAGFQNISSQGEEPLLSLVLSPPWWSTSSFMVNGQSIPLPPPAFALSVVSRIKYSSFGWLNTVSNAATAATGKVFVPSGAVAAVFHNSVTQCIQHGKSKASSLEHLLVFTPSGYVVQHELVPSIGMEPRENGSRSQTATSAHIQEDDLRVKVEPMQWWDACRRSDWQEREESLTENTSDGQHVYGITPKAKLSHIDAYVTDVPEVNGNVCGQRTLKDCSVKPSRNPHSYISNAELCPSRGRLPAWQNSKVSFHVMDSPGDHCLGDGELEIEKVSTHEVEIRRKELLPFFDHFQGVKPSWNDRFLAMGRHSPLSSSEFHQVDNRIAYETVLCHSKPASLCSTESSEGGSSRRIENLLDLDQINIEKASPPAYDCSSGRCMGRKGNATNELHLCNLDSLSLVSSFKGDRGDTDTHMDKCLTNGLTKQCANDGCCDVLVCIPRQCDLHTMTLDAGSGLSVIQSPEEIGLSLREEHCKASDPNGCQQSNEVTSDDLDSSSSHCDKEKLDEDGENDETVGGVFGFVMED